MSSFINRLFQRKDKPAEPESTPARKGLGIGSVVADRYRLDAEIGRGGMGIVYRAHDLQSDRDVALKVINTETADTRTREQFLHEAQVTSRLHHPHIVDVLGTGSVDVGDVGAAQPILFLAMEYVPGTSLDRMRYLPIARVVDLARQICDALEYAHNQGLVHRDIKPQNVLLERRGFGYVAKLVDFGLARPLDAPQPANEGPTGTVYYIAPEVIAGQPADVAADLYSFGALMYEMVTGRVPFSNYDEASILTQHLTEAVAPPHETRPDIPPALEAIILRLLDKDPRNRYASTSEVCRELGIIEATLGNSGGRTNLAAPAEPNPEFARASAQIRDSLATNRLVSLTGARSSALAAAVGHDLLPEFRDGVWQVNLETCTDPACVPEALATVLGVKEEPGRTLTVSLRQYLQEKNLLLILRGCGSVAGGCARLAEMLLQTCPEVYILTTGSSPLNIANEQVYDASEAA